MILCITTTFYGKAETERWVREEKKRIHERNVCDKLENVHCHRRWETQFQSIVE